MTLLTAAIAAVIVTLVWYFKDGTNEMRIGTLSLMYWGATLMWLVDAVVEYIELKAAYFTPEPVDMLNDFFLGISVVVLGLIIWLVMFLIQRSKGRAAETVTEKIEILIVPFLKVYSNRQEFAIADSCCFTVQCNSCT